MMPTSLSFLDDIRSVFGKIRHRCTQCGHKPLVRVWPILETRHAHCPRCFSTHLQRWNAVFVASFLHKALIRYLGGHSYRCLECSFAFVSMRKAKSTLRRAEAGIALPEQQSGPKDAYTYTYEYYGEYAEEPLPKQNADTEVRREYAG